MKQWIRSRLSSKANFNSLDEYKGCLEDLLTHEAVLMMDRFPQHGRTTCLEHSMFVSYTGYKICRVLGLDWRSAARGGMLHDLFLYDWHTTKPAKGLHGFTHPLTALENAHEYFDLNDREKDIILKHMWPLTVKPPKYKEAFIIALIDKYWALLETLQLGEDIKLGRLKKRVYDQWEVSARQSHVTNNKILGVEIYE
ncbi:HD family phosphohydrolase [Desulfitobacterium sp. THU1]|uniref:HD family phosphohydrolase n=1 Tax=Desulfitobacterium sp. THU1 TaxID=3138072 RepID=UPI00311E5E57